ncbi:hypothetical protein ACWA7J_10615 [Leptothrix sp. BB-4]
MNSSGIDTSALLTMLGLIAAVWAVVPSTARLSFRLSLTWFDWLVVWTVLLTIHGFFFEPVLKQLGFPHLGPWLWGFDKSATQYSLFLLLAAFVYWRSSRTKLTRWNIGLFDELTTALLHSGKHEELSDLLQRHLRSALDLAQARTVRSQVADFIRPARPNFQVLFGEDGTITFGTGGPTKWLPVQWFSLREWFADLVGPSRRVQHRASSVVRRLLSSRRLVAQLAAARPFLCIEVMEAAVRLEEGFQDEFFRALLANDASIFYSEIKNNDNHEGRGRRLHLPTENRLLRFYFVDAQVAGRLGVYRSVGEAVLARIEGDDVLERRLNGRPLTFDEVGKHTDPVHTGLWFFRVMVLEGLHQRLPDHLWLHYMPHFAGRLVDRAREIRPDDETHEFPTPLAYLLYEVVETTVTWVREAVVLTAPGQRVSADQLDGDHVFIAFEAAEAVGRVLHPILASSRVTWRLKSELFGVALSALRDLEQLRHLEPLATVLRRHLIEPYEFRETHEQLSVLQQCFADQDHVLRGHLGRFEAELDAALAAAR